MTISVRSRIFVTTPDGRSHTGVVTGLRGQGMADLLLDDGRAIRQPVSALRPALARPNGRYARHNPRARRNTGEDVYLRAARMVLGVGELPKLTDQQLEDLTGGKDKALALVAGIKERLQRTSPPILKRATPTKEQREAAAAARRVYGEAARLLDLATTRALDYRDAMGEVVTPAVLARLGAAAQAAKEVYKQLQERIDAMEKSTALFFADGAAADDSEKAVAQLAQALREKFGEGNDGLPARVEADKRVAIEEWDGDTKVAGDNYILLRLLLNLLSGEDTPAKAAAKSEEELQKERKEQQEEGLQRRARVVRTSRQEDRTEGQRALRARRERLGGIGLQEFVERQKVAAAIVPDPLRATKDKGHLCGNALDGYAYTLATTSVKRTVKHWLTWRDLGYTGSDESNQIKPSYEVISTSKQRGGAGKSAETPETLSVESLIKLFDGAEAPLGRDYNTVTVRRVGSRTEPKLTRTPVSRELESGGVYNEFEVFPVRDKGQAIVYTTEDAADLTQAYTPVDIKPALQRVRAGTQGGSLYPRRPMPPESRTPGEFNPDAPVLLTADAVVPDVSGVSGAFGSPYVFGFTVEKEVETASLLLDKYKPYPGYSFKDRSPYFSWQPEAAGQFSAMQGAKGERPCTDPEVVAQLNAMRKASLTLLNLVKQSRRLNEVLTDDDGLSTTDGEATQKKLVPVFQRLVGAGVRVARLSSAISEQRYIGGSRRDTSSDFGVFTDSVRLVTAVQGAPAPTDRDPNVAKLREKQHAEAAQAITGVLEETRKAMQALDEQLQRVEIVRTVTTTQKNDMDRVDFEPAELDAYFRRLAQYLQSIVSTRLLAEGVTQYTLSQSKANAKDARLLLVAGALASGACFAEVLASLFPLERLAPAPAAGETDTAVGQAFGQSSAAEQLAMIQLRTACTPHAQLPSERRASLETWWRDLRKSLPDEARSLLPPKSTGLQRRFKHLLDFLFAREISALRSSFSFGRAYDAQFWEGDTDPTAAVILYLYTATFIGQANIGGLLGSPVLREEDTRSRARANAGGSTEDDNMSKRAADRGYEPEKPLSREEQRSLRKRQEELQRKPRAERKQLADALRLKSQEKEAERAAAVAAAAAAADAQAKKGDTDTVVSLADRLRASMEFAQRALVGGGRVAEIEERVKVHYTYNPLLFQLVRLYYRQDIDKTSPSSPAAPAARTNPKPEPPNDIYDELSAMLVPQTRLPNFSVFALQIADLRGPAPTPASLRAQIRQQLAAFPQVYEKTLSLLASKQISPVQAANELRENVPSLSDSLRYYHSRIEKAGQEGEGSKNLDADRKTLLLAALSRALSRSPGTPAQSDYDPNTFDVVTEVTGRTVPGPAPAFVAPPRPYQAPAAPKVGDTSTRPAVSPRAWQGFSQAVGDKGEYAFHNKELLYMIDWIGVYGSLLDLVRRAVLKFEAEDFTPASDWDEVYEGWVLFFADKTKATKGDGKDIPQLWLDLCPAERDLKLWAQDYRAATDDGSGHAIRDLVLRTKGHAARGLAFAGELARRGHGDAGRRPDQHHLAAPSTEDLFLRMEGNELTGPRAQALIKLFKENALAFRHFMARRYKNTREEIDKGHEDYWRKVAEASPDVESDAVTLVRQSLRPLVVARLLSLPDARAVLEALTETARPGAKSGARSVAFLPAALASTYVAALLRFRDQYGSLPTPRSYPTAPNVESVRPMQATAADTEHEPPDSFLSISLDREHMRGTLLKMIEQEQKRLVRALMPKQPSQLV